MNALMAAIGACLHAPPAAAPGGWVAHNVFTPTTPDWAVLIPGASTVMALAGSSGTCAVSTDDGETWLQVTSPGVPTLPYLCGFEIGTTIVLPQNGASTGAVSTNNGNTWGSESLVYKPSLGYITGTWQGACVANGIGIVWAGGGFGGRTTDGVGFSYIYGGNHANFSATAYGGGVFAAIASGTANVGTSTNGTTWTASSLPSSAAWSAIAYGNGRFCTIASGGTKAATSPTGATWTARTLPASLNWSAIAYGAGLFVALASGTDQYATSPDGVTWTLRSMPASAAWSSLVFTGTAFVAIASDRASAERSTDGLAWESKPLPMDPLPNGSWSDLATDGSHYIAVSTYPQDGAACVTSEDGDTFSIGTLSDAYAWGGIAFGNGVAVAVSIGVADADCQSAVSSDGGATWTLHQLPSSLATAVARLIFGNGFFMLVPKDAGFVFTSTDGETWSLVDLPTGMTDIPWADAVFTNGHFMLLSALMDGGGHYQFVSLSTDDAVTWRGNTTGADIKPWSAIGRCTDRTVAVGQGYSAHMFDNDSNMIWYITTPAAAPTLSPGDLVFDGTNLLAITESAVRATVDGITWSTPAQPPARAATRFVNAGGVIYALGNDIASYTPQ